MTLAKLILYSVFLPFLFGVEFCRAKQGVSQNLDFHAALRCAGFPGIDSAWVIYNSRELLHTENEGSTWSRLSAEAVGQIRTASFIDSNHGWAANEQQQIWMTDNGGRSWVRVANLDGKSPITSITFIDSLHGWVTGPFSIWRSEDSGGSWQNYITYDRPNGSKSQNSGGFFLNDLLGWAGASNGVIHRTIDGGITWQSQKVIEKNLYVRDIVFINPQTGWFCDFPTSAIYRSDDSGNTWLAAKIPSPNLGLESISFVDDKEGWAAGTDREPGAVTSDRVWAVLLHTTDGGKTWDFANTGIKDVFYTKVYFANSKKGWLASKDKLYRTANGGKTWQLVLNVSDKQ